MRVYSDSDLAVEGLSSREMSEVTENSLHHRAALSRSESIHCEYRVERPIVFSHRCFHGNEHSTPLLIELNNVHRPCISMTEHL